MVFAAGSGTPTASAPYDQATTLYSHSRLLRRFPVPLAKFPPSGGRHRTLPAPYRVAPWQGIGLVPQKVLAQSSTLPAPFATHTQSNAATIIPSKEVTLNHAKADI